MNPKEQPRSAEEIIEQYLRFKDHKELTPYEAELLMQEFHAQFQPQPEPLVEALRELIEDCVPDEYSLPKAPSLTVIQKSKTALSNHDQKTTL